MRFLWEHGSTAKNVCSYWLTFVVFALAPKCLSIVFWELRGNSVWVTESIKFAKCVSVHEAAVHKFSVQKCSTEVCTNMKVTVHAPSSEDVCMQWCNAMFVVSAWGNRL